MKILKQFLTIIFSFILAINVFLYCSFPVSASGASPSKEFQFPSDWDDYTLNQKLYFVQNDSDFKKLPIESQVYYLDKYRLFGSDPILSRLEDTLACLVSGKLGVAYSNSVAPSLMDAWSGARDVAYEQDVDILTKDSNGEVYLSDSYLSIFREFLDEFVDANSPKYRIIDTFDYRQINASKYIDKTQYDSAQLFLKQHENDLIINFSPKVNTSTSSYTFFIVVPEKNILAFAMFTSGTPCVEVVNPDYKFLGIVDCYVYDTTQNAYRIYASSNGTPYYNYTSTPRLYTGTGFSNLPALFENCSYKNGKPVMVFDSREHAVDWITGTRDVYTTSSFGSYQSGNSIRITGDTLTNSGNVYTIVNNTVNNYYGDDDEDGGGGSNFTDGDIQDIIDKAVNDALNPDPGTGSGGDNSGSGSGSGGTVSGGDSSGGSSGSGFTGFLEGLGKLLDGVLAIVGKLLEYIGKAIELFVDTIAKVLDIVPKAFSEFLAAVFPFFPTEIFTAIELILALSVVLMVIKMFKK